MSTPIGITTAITLAKTYNAEHQAKMERKEEAQWAKIIVHTSQIPAGAKLVEAYETDSEIIVMGWPKEDDESHNCDQMGCAFNHVMHRFSKEKQ